MSNMRAVFTDGFNSFWHLVFGAFAVKYNILIILFTLYQFIDMAEVNLKIDMAEFFIGYLGALLVSTHTKLLL
jgi:hypothetical protein